MARIKKKKTFRETNKVIKLAPKERAALEKRRELYRSGPEGFYLFCEENICVSVYTPGESVPHWVLMGELKEDDLFEETGRSYKQMWENQKALLYDALEMRNGEFLHRLIVLCWMRGEGKSFVVCLIQLWKFFCFDRQQIMLGANSRDQVKFVHYDIMRDIILNSPRLLYWVGGTENIQEKEIRLKDEEGRVVSIVRSISSFSGIVSNITGYTFSEIFDMKNPKFFVQLDGSIRNIPNALGVVDSTVSTKDHILYKLYETDRKGSDEFLWFSHRESPNASHKDFWHPRMTQAQLDSYKTKFPIDEFDRYFRNTWEAGASKFFPIHIVDASSYIAIDGIYGGGTKLVENCRKIHQRLRGADAAEKAMQYEKAGDMRKGVEKLKNRMTPVEEVYSLTGPFGESVLAGMDELEQLSEMFSTDFAVGVGIDRADPTRQAKFGARTILTVSAKGLPGSRNNPDVLNDGNIDRFLYFLIGFRHVANSSMEGIQEYLNLVDSEVDGLDVVCCDRWGMWDLTTWCDEKGVAFDPLAMSYAKQQAAFTELYQAMNTGRFKRTRVATQGSKSDDLLQEELEVFDHNVDRKIYGSPEKKDRFGIQDDSIDSLALSIYGMREMGPFDFKRRFNEKVFGIFVENRNLRGRY